MEWMLLVLLGVGVGAAAGLMGVGGGILLVPALIYLFKFSQKEAQGTSLAMLVPPIGIFAAYEYWKQGYVKLGAAGAVAIGFVVGSLVTSSLIGKVSDPYLRKGFGVLLLFLGVRMLLGK